MSLYDMYFSKKNKNHMYEVLSNVIREEVGIHIMNDPKYIDIYRLHYASIFESSDTDEISILNRAIINDIGEIILNEIHMIKIDTKDTKDTIDTKDTKDTIDTKDTQDTQDTIDESVIRYTTGTEGPDIVRKMYSIHSSNRGFSSLNRYNFQVNIDSAVFFPKSVCLVKEQNSLFSNGTINVQFNEKDNILFSLDRTSNLGSNEYYTYECITDNAIECSGTLKIRIQNYLMMDPLSVSDRYAVDKVRKVDIDDSEMLCFDIMDHDIKVDDELGLYHDGEILETVFVKKIMKNYILTNTMALDLNDEYTCLQMNKNVQIDGHI